jgi:hypothetical protein
MRVGEFIIAGKYDTWTILRSIEDCTKSFHLDRVGHGRINAGVDAADAFHPRSM